MYILDFIVRQTLVNEVLKVQQSLVWTSLPIGHISKAVGVHFIFQPLKYSEIGFESSLNITYTMYKFHIAKELVA